mmetsp:Transcript_31821/g.54271  ORF Transcript_31821/g.54271 Transcript_31821/m.54271 type:complete len:145 (-) Transcript_31821:672-1106(-)
MKCRKDYNRAWVEVVEVQLNPMKGEEEVLLLDPQKVEEVLLNLRKEEAQLCPYDIDFDDALVVALKVVALAVEEEAEVGLHVLDPLEAEVVVVPFRQDSFHIAPAAAAETVEYVAIVVDGMAAADDDDESAAVAFVVGAAGTDL